MIIAIDGAVATGKTTIAKTLAEKLGYIFFDTGAMYRAFTHKLVQEKVDLSDEKQIDEALKNFHFDVRMVLGNKRYFVDNEDVTEIIRTIEVTNTVSRVASLKNVRERLVAIQREFAKGVHAVFEGRDMGTVVFPNAECKVFLTGDETIRAQRRLEELLERNPELPLTLEDVLNDLQKRDNTDSTREISPLRKADDALAIDTTYLTVTEIVNKILEYKDSKHLPTD